MGRRISGSLEEIIWETRESFRSQDTGQRIGWKEGNARHMSLSKTAGVASWKEPQTRVRTSGCSVGPELSSRVA